jgi:AraC-like DNA-binding protein
LSETYEKPAAHLRCEPPPTHLAETIGVQPRQYTRSWNGLRAEVVEVHGPGPYVADIRSDKPRLIVVLEAVGGHVDIRPAPDRPEPSKHRLPHQLVFVPASLPAWEHAEGFLYMRRVAIDFDPARLAPNTRIGAQGRALVRLSSAHLCSVAALLADECIKVGAASQAYGTSLGLVIFHHLAALLEVERPGRSTGGLTPLRLRRTIEFMEQRWAGSVGLSELANVAGLSQSYFSRAFRASTGMSPLQWLQALRVRRAQQMLLETDASLSDLALKCGFADQSHFTRTFHAIAGEPPGAWRKSRKLQAA